MAISIRTRNDLPIAVVRTLTVWLLVCSVVLLPQCSSAVGIWDGSSDGLWATGANWDTDAVPGDGVNLTFNDVTNQTLTLGTTRIVGTMTFNAADAYSLDGGGNTFKLGGTVTQNGAGAVTIRNVTFETQNAPRTFTGTGTGEFTIGGGGKVTGSGLLTFAGGNYTIQNGTGDHDYSGGISVTGGRLRLYNGAGDLSISTVGNTGYAGTGAISINGGELRLDASGNITGLARAVTFGANGGTLDFARPVTNLTPSSLVINSGANSSIIKYGTIAAATGAGGWTAAGNDLNIANLSGTGKLNLQATNGATMEYQQASFGGTLLVTGVSGGNAGAASTATNVGRFALSTAATATVTGGVSFENAVQVTTYGAQRTLDSNITIKAGSATAFQGRAETTAQTDDLILGATANGRTLTIENGGTAIMDLRFRNDTATNIGGVTLNAQTVLNAGGTLRFDRTVAGGTVERITANGDLTGQGSAAADSVIDLRLGSGAGGVDFLTGAGTAGVDLIVNGSGTGGLRIQGTKAHVDALLTTERFQDLTGTGGTLTIAYSDAASRTFSAQPSAASNVKLGFDAQGGSAPTYTIGVATNDLTRFNGLVVKGGTVTAAADQSFTGTTTSTFDIAGGTLNLGGGSAARTLTFGGGATLSAGVIDGGSNAAKGTLVLGGNLVTNGTTVSNSPNITLNPTTGTTVVSGSSALSGLGTFTKNGAGTSRLDLQLSATNSTVSQGTLQLGVANGLGTGTTLTVNSGAIFDLNNNSQTIGSLSGSGNVRSSTGSAATFTINNASDATFSGTIGASGANGLGLAKAGAGTLQLSAANTFTGNTSVSGGTLSLLADSALGSTGKVTVNTGGTLLLGTTAGANRINNAAEVALAGGTLGTGGFSEQVGKLTLTVNSTLDFGSGASLMTFDGTSSLGTSTLTVLNWSGTMGATGGMDRLLFTNSAFTGFAGSSQIQFNIGGTLYDAEFRTIDANTIEAIAVNSVVPEPSTIFAVSLVGILISWRERSRLGLLLRLVTQQFPRN